MTRCLQSVVLSLSLVAALGLPWRPASAADSPAAIVASAPVSDRDLGSFPFLPALDGFEPVPATASSWTRDGNFIRYHFQYAPEQAVEVGGRFMMRHFAARDPVGQSLDSIVDSYGMLVEEKGGILLYRGLFHGGAIDTAARSEQQARMGATYLIRTPEREIWMQISVRDEGGEYVLVVLEKGPLQLKTMPLASSELKRSLDETGKAILYVNFEFDRANLRPDSKPVLDSVYSLLKAEPSLKLSIGGHTDNLGGDAYNQALSEKRAQAVREALIARGLKGKDAERLDATGYGATMPIAGNETEEGRARNRRVELVKRQ